MKPLLTDDAALQHLGDRLRQLRLRKDITQSQLAKECGLGKSTIERFEKGSSIQLKSLIRILRSLGTLETLLDLIPDQRLSPMEILARKEPGIYRASSKREAGDTKPWKWGDE